MTDMRYTIDSEYAHLQTYPWSGMNNGLYGIYKKYKNDVLDPTNFFTSHYDYELPYLIAASKNYEKAPYKIMVVGQETMSWGGEFSHNNNYSPINPWNFEVEDYNVILRNLKYPNDILQALMLLYDERVNKEWGLGGHLWQFYINLISGLEKQAPYKFGLIHNNIAKIANKAGDKVDGVGSNYSINESLIGMIKDEITITDPNIIICCLGNHNHYQKLVSFINPNIGELVRTLSASNVVTDLSEIEICNKSRKVICCYHPRYLNSKKGGIKTTTDKIISMLRKAYNVSIIP